MANTDVVLRDEMGARVPSVSQVTITAGDSVTFSVQDGADSVLYFSPHTASIISPKPGTRVSLAFGQKLVYTFAAARSGAYGVFIEAPGDPAPANFEFGKPTEPPVLVVKTGRGINFGGPTNDTQT